MSGKSVGNFKAPNTLEEIVKGLDLIFDGPQVNVDLVKAFLESFRPDPVIWKAAACKGETTS